MLDQALADLDETTEVTVGTDARVAGRDVYELILTPRTEDTLVGEIRFAIDGENGVALAASVTARGASEPAFQTGFTQVDFSVPDPAVFAFTPGEGITVTENEIALPDRCAGPRRRDDGCRIPRRLRRGLVDRDRTAQHQRGGHADVFSGLDPEQLQLLDSLTTAVDGGRVLQTSLVTVLITDDGRVLAGAVPAARLVEAAQTGR